MCPNLPIRQNYPETGISNRSLLRLTVQIWKRKAISHYERSRGIWKDAVGFLPE
jgi:hypothetical protein